MTYEILNTTTVGETLITTVKYNFSGTEVTVDISHFMPETSADVTTGILNRAISEQAKLDAIANLSTVVSGLTLNEVITIV